LGDELVYGSIDSRLAVSARAMAPHAGRDAGAWPTLAVPGHATGSPIPTQYRLIQNGPPKRAILIEFMADAENWSKEVLLPSG